MFSLSSHGVVEEVSIQSGTDTTQVRVLVSNPGLVAAEYSVHLYHCQPTLHAPELHSSLMEPHGAGHFVFALQNPTLGAHVENATCTGRGISTNHWQLILTFHDATTEYIWENTRAHIQYKMSYPYRKSHCEDKTVVRSSYLNNGISYTGKTTSFWIGTQEHSWWCPGPCRRVPKWCCSIYHLHITFGPPLLEKLCHDQLSRHWISTEK